MSFNSDNSMVVQTLCDLQTSSSLFVFVAWLSGNTFDSINKVTLCRARLVLRWVTACRQVNHLSI